MKLHLPKGLFTAILAAFAVVTPSVYGADSISISFGGTTMSGVTDEASQLGGVTKDGWNIVPASNTNGTTVNNQNGTAAGTLVMSGIFGSYDSSVTDTTTVSGVVQRNYIDIKNHSGGNVHTISLSHNYWLADVTYYLSGDAGGTWAPMEVNGTQYIGGTDNTLDEGENPAWGTRGGVTEYGDGNSITVTGLAGGTIVGKNVYTSSTARATLGGMQVVDSSATRGYMTTLGAGETTATAATWTLNGQEVQYGNISTPKSLGVSAAAEGSTLKLASGDSINSIAVQANTLTVASDGTIGLNDIYLNSGTTFNLNAGITSGTNLSVRGAGTAHINASQTLASLSSTVSTLGIGGNSTITVSGAASFAGLDVAAGSKLALNGSVDGSFILNTTGSGTIELNNGQTVIIPGIDNGSVGDTGTVSSIKSTAFTGVISIKSGMLSLGNNGEWQGYWGLNLGSLKSIDLDGGSLRLFGAASTISTINVNAASSMTIQQASVTQGAADEATSGLPGYRINSLVLNENLSVRTNWRSVVEIGKLSGAADLSMDTAASGRVLSLYINEVDATAGMNMNFAANVNATLGGAANSELTDVAHTLGGTITTAANLTVNGSITIVDDLSAFRLHTQSSGGTLTENGGQDGYMTTTGSTYYLIDNTGSGTVTLSSSTATYGGKTVELTKDSAGDVTFVGGTNTDTLYRVNTTDVTVGGTSATANTERATAFIIAQDRTVTIAGDSAAATASTILRDSSGEGNLVLSTDATLQGGQQTQLGGKLTVGEGVTLTVGAGFGDSSNISSFKDGVELAGGSLMINGAAQEVNSLTVSKASILGIANKNQGHQTYTLTGTTQLNADLEYTNSVANEHGDLVIKNLSGSGTLSTNGGTGSWGANALKVETATSYTGTIKVDGGNRDNYRNYVEFGTSTTEGDVTTKTSAFSTLKGLELTNKAYATVHSTANSTIEKVVLNNGSLQYASDGGSYTYSLGDVTSDGASSISMDAGKAEITKLTLNSGQLSVTGSLTIGELVLDLSKYDDMAQTYTLVTTTGEGATVGLTTAYSTEYNGYTASVSGSGTDSLTLSFSEIVAPGGEITTTVTGIDSFTDGVLTLIIDKSITSADLKANITGFGDGVLDSILSMTATDADGIVGITLIDTDELTSDSIVGNGADNLGFYGAYYGEGVGAGYQVAYIPEPATATLSLLALAGLAARRRRKH